MHKFENDALRDYSKKGGVNKKLSVYFLVYNPNLKVNFTSNYHYIAFMFT